MISSFAEALVPVISSLIQPSIVSKLSDATLDGIAECDNDDADDDDGKKYVRRPTPLVPRRNNSKKWNQVMIQSLQITH